VRLEDEMPLVEVLRFQPRREQGKLLVRRSDRLAQPDDLGGHELSRDRSIDDDHAGNEQARLADGDAAGGRDPAERPPCRHPRTVAPADGANNAIGERTTGTTR